MESTLSHGAEGRAEVSFKSYVAKDRHGADLSGELYGDEDQDGRGGKKHESKGGIESSSQVAVKKAHGADL